MLKPDLLIFVSDIGMIVLRVQVTESIDMRDMHNPWTHLRLGIPVEVEAGMVHGAFHLPDTEMAGNNRDPELGCRRLHVRQFRVRGSEDRACKGQWMSAIVYHARKLTFLQTRLSSPTKWGLTSTSNQRYGWACSVQHYSFQDHTSTPSRTLSASLS
jgi:hypothetical protein